MVDRLSVVSPDKHTSPGVPLIIVPGLHKRNKQIDSLKLSLYITNQ